MVGKQKGAITWKELAKHNKRRDCWLAIEGKVYNVTSFLERHPGGAEMLLLCAGRDCTELFHSYHPFTNKPDELLAKFEVGELEADAELPLYTKRSKFYETVSERVRTYFELSNQDHKVHYGMMMRYVALFIIYVWSYHVMALGAGVSSGIVRFLSAAVFGLANAGFGLTMMHDSSHAAFTHNPKVWKYGGYAYDLLTGASFHAWLHQHTIGHHVYTNVRGADPDVGGNDPDFRRIHDKQTPRWWYPYQHIYAPVLYGLLSIKVRVQDIEETFMRNVNGVVRVNPEFSRQPERMYVMFAGKALFVLMRFLVPLMSGMTLGQTLFAFAVAEAATSYYLAFNFQVSHMAEGLDMYDVSQKAIAGDWAELQVRTSQDYAHGQLVPTVLSGGLNYQVVHHLFPTVCQAYYAEIAPIVMNTCKEFDIPYQVVPTWSGAILSHIEYLRIMGEKGKPHEM